MLVPPIWRNLLGSWIQEAVISGYIKKRIRSVVGRGSGWVMRCAYESSFYIACRIIQLDHGFARVAHCATPGWRNFSHYCCPLRQFDVFWAQRSTDRCADRTRCTQTRVYIARGKCIVRHCTSREDTLRHSSGWGDLKRFPTVSWFAHPWTRPKCCNKYKRALVNPLIIFIFTKWK